MVVISNHREQDDARRARQQRYQPRRLGRAEDGVAERSWGHLRSRFWPGFVLPASIVLLLLALGPLAAGALDWTALAVLITKGFLAG